MLSFGHSIILSFDHSVILSFGHSIIRLFDYFPFHITFIFGRS